MAGEHRLGRSKKDDYGLAGVRVGQPQTTRWSRRRRVRPRCGASPMSSCSMRRCGRAPARTTWRERWHAPSEPRSRSSMMGHAVGVLAHVPSRLVAEQLGPASAIAGDAAGRLLSLRVTIGKGGQPACWRTQDGLLVTMVGERNAEGFGLVAIGAAALADRTIQPTAVDPRHRVPAGVDKAAAGEASGDAFVEGLARNHSVRSWRSRRRRWPETMPVGDTSWVGRQTSRRAANWAVSAKLCAPSVPSRRATPRPAGGLESSGSTTVERSGTSSGTAALVGSRGPRLRGTRSGGPRRALR